MTEEESIFDTAGVEEVSNVETSSEETEEEKEWVPTVSSESPKDKKERIGVKKEMDGEVVKIKSYFFTKPRTTNPDGTRKEPKKTQNEDKEFYSGKLGIRFDKDNLVEYYPSFHYFVNEDGKVNNFAKINRKGENAITKIFKLVVAKMSKPEEEVSDQAAFEFLVGKEVKLKTTKGTYQGRKWFRNDIVEIL